MDILMHQVPLEDQPMDCDFHPSQPIVATGLIDGKLLLHSFDKDQTKLKKSIKAHSGSCRAVRFALGGDMLMSASADQSLLAVDLETGKALARKKEAHENAINRLAALGPTLTASGDDSGVIKLWDSRQSDAVASFDAHCEFVSDLALQEPDNCLLSVSGDGTLSVIDLKTNKTRASSEGDADDELLSVAAIKGGKKLVCGSQSGVLSVWSWGYWNDCSDRFPGHPNSVDAVLKFDEDSILTGSSDGMIRIISVQPNKMLGVIGEHTDYPIERLAISGDKAVLASASHDNTIKLWDLGALDEDSEDEDEIDDRGGEGACDAAEQEAGDAAVQVRQPDSGQGTGEGQIDSDGESSDSDAPAQKKRKKGAHKIPNKQQQKQKSSNFFADIL